MGADPPVDFPKSSSEECPHAPSPQSFHMHGDKIMTKDQGRNETCAVPPVTRKTLIIEVLQTRPLAGKVLREAFGLPCEECVVAETETIEQGARYYGHDADQIVAKLNDCPTQNVVTDAAHEMKPRGESTPQEPGK